MKFRNLLAAACALFASAANAADGDLLTCGTIDSTFLPSYLLNVRAVEPGSSAVKVSVERASWDERYQLVTERSSRDGTLVTGGDGRLALVFDGGAVAGRELPNGVFSAHGDIDEDHDLELSCAFLYWI